MTEWKARRFWKEAQVAETGTGYTVHLDGRPVRTPAKRAMDLPTRAMAEAMATEWDAQEDEIAPLTMPVTRSANAALDKVALQRDEVVEMLAAYGETDLLCYRAEGPDALAARQAEHWDPMLDWAADTLGARLVLIEGVMPRPQPEESLAKLHSVLNRQSDFELAASHDLIAISGSLVLGLAAAADVAPPDRVWELSRLDERWQEEQWGIDEEAREVEAVKRAAFLHAHRFLHLARG